jgi:hypothetical protein
MRNQGKVKTEFAGSHDFSMALHPGFWVVFNATFTSKDSAKQLANHLGPGLVMVE